MKRGFAWLLTLLALLGLLSGCGGGGDTTVSDTASNSAAIRGTPSMQQIRMPPVRNRSR